MLTYDKLKEKPADFLCATGLTVSEFEQLLVAFEQIYQRKYGSEQTVTGQLRQRKAGGGAKGRLASSQAKLLFILVYEKTYPLQTMHGLAFGLSQERTNEWIHRLLPVLQEALAGLGMQPTREASALAVQPALQDVPADLLVDGSERRHQRPQDPDQQVALYSGKKKRIPTRIY
jgi:Helix-turn-helix of DDE superfamily endonuclease